MQHCLWIGMAYGLTGNVERVLSFDGLILYCLSMRWEFFFPFFFLTTKSNFMRYVPFFLIVTGEKRGHDWSPFRKLGEILGTSSSSYQL